MKYITDTLDFSLERRSAVTLGKFDGLHRGHQKLVNRIREFGKDGFETVIFTFDVTPLALLGKGAKEMLLTPCLLYTSYQLSLAIGKEGQNARLAARLTGYKIDIKSETQAREAGDFDYYEEDEYEEEYPEEPSEEMAEEGAAAEEETFDMEQE